MPTGGVDLNTIRDFINAGCAAVGAGSSLVSAKILQDGAWAELTQRAKDFVQAAAEARQKK